jgi:lipopolysaccharide biosynthesis glycosyltransferase
LTAYDLVEVDCAIYLDRDAIVLGSLWDFYSLACNLDTKLLGMSPEGGNWYTSNHGTNRSGLSYVPNTGVNGGILAMNLKSMRQTGFASTMMGVYEHYKPLKYDLRLGDQDLLNIYFAEHPELLEIMECKYNQRIHNSICECCQARMMEDSVVLHGNRAAFHHEPLFKTIWDQFLASNVTYHGAQLMMLNEANHRRLMTEYKKLLNSYG